MVVGLALLLSGCASLRLEPVWICGNDLILMDEEPAVEAAAVPAPALAGHDTNTVQVKPDKDDVIIMSHCCWDEPEPRKRAEAAVMY